MSNKVPFEPCRRALVWFRRDLRDFDHAALAAALREADEVYCLFVFDRAILDGLPRQDRRVQFIHSSLQELDQALRRRGGGLIVRQGNAVEEVCTVAQALVADAVFTHRDYEPAAKGRDAEVADQLRALAIAFRSFKDQAVFDQNEVLTAAGGPFSVFTPYYRAWRKRLEQFGAGAHHVQGKLAASVMAQGVPELTALGFSPCKLGESGIAPGMTGGAALWEDFAHRMRDYRAFRDFPARNGVSSLSIHLRFGTVSIRSLVTAALTAGNEGAETWLKELAWRDFYFQILDHFPHVSQGAFRPVYDAIVWDDWPEGFAAWCEGRTGYPLVDAAMRQLVSSGSMHNRLRMVVASFLTKDMGIDWRKGEAFFALHLNDFDLSANNGGWQWAASTGCDAQPYFRIFNPVTQSQRFDPDGAFIRRHLPELRDVSNRHIHAPWEMSVAVQEELVVVIGVDYPPPIVSHEKARQRTLARYKLVTQAA